MQGENHVKNRSTGAFVYVTQDFGKSFEKRGVCVAHNRDCDEHMIVELENGILMMLIRTKKGIEKTYSYNYGKSWTDCIPFEIPNPISRFHLRKLKSGGK